MTADLSPHLCRTKGTGYTKYTGTFRSFTCGEISRCQSGRRIFWRSCAESRTPDTQSIPVPSVLSPAPKSLAVNPGGGSFGAAVQNREHRIHKVYRYLRFFHLHQSLSLSIREADLSPHLCRTKGTGYTKYTGTFRSFTCGEISRCQSGRRIFYLNCAQLQIAIYRSMCRGSCRGDH